MDQISLAIKAKLVNRAHRYGRKISPILMKKLAPFVGKRITGELLGALPELPRTEQLQVLYCTSKTCIWLTVTAIEWVDNYKRFVFESTVYVGELNRGILLWTYPVFKRQSNYTAKTIANNDWYCFRGEYRRRKNRC